MVQPQTFYSIFRVYFFSVGPSVPYGLWRCVVLGNPGKGLLELVLSYAACGTVFGPLAEPPPRHLAATWWSLRRTKLWPIYKVGEDLLRVDAEMAV